MKRNRADELRPTGNNRSVFLSARPGEGGQGLGAMQWGLPKTPQARHLESPHPLWASTHPFSDYHTLP